MDINISLIGQMLTFTVLVWFTMRFVWPPVTEAMEQRRQKVADGLAAAEQGEHKLELATERAKTMLQEAKEQAAGLIDQAEKRGHQLIEAAKNDAKTEAERLVKGAQAEINRQYREAKSQLKNELAGHTLKVAEKVLTQSLDEDMRTVMMDHILKEV